MKIFLLILLINSLFLSGQLLLKDKIACAENKDFNQLRSTHFIVNYQNGIGWFYANEIKKKAEEFYRKITQEFGLVRDKLWLWDNRAKIFIAKDKKEYLKNFNCPDWSAACVDYEAKKIFTYPGQNDFIPILAHELTHIIFREYITRQTLPLWLDEGMAIYIEAQLAKADYRQSFYWVQKMIKDNNFIPFNELMNLSALALKGKPSSYVEAFYLQSFSIVNFLIEEYQKHHFSELLWRFKGEKDIEKALARTYYHFRNIDALEREWKKFYLK